MDNYSSKNGAKNSSLAWLIFVSATFFSQIIILNMLIAIMSDTYDRVMEMQEIAKMKLKVSILDDLSHLVEVEEKLKRYLFAATQQNSDDVEANEWVGKIAAIKRIIVN